MLGQRQQHVCGLAKGGTEIVLAGGQDNNSNTKDRVYIYDIAANSWRQSGMCIKMKIRLDKAVSMYIFYEENKLPEKITDGIVVPYCDSFLLVGGYISGGLSIEHVYEYVPDTEEWLKLAGTAGDFAGRYAVAAAFIDRAAFPGCSSG